MLLTVVTLNIVIFFGKTQKEKKKIQNENKKKGEEKQKHVACDIECR